MFRQRFLTVPVISGDAVSGMHAEAAEPASMTDGWNRYIPRTRADIGKSRTD